VISLNKITRQVNDYIGFKQSLGFKINIEAAELRRFAAFTESIHYDGPVCGDIVQAWIGSKPNISEWFASRRRETIATFARYITFYDPSARLIPKGRIRSHERTEPYVYTESETALIIKEMSNLYSPDGLRRLSAPAIIALLWATGLRPQEALKLRDVDVDLSRKVIHVNETKFTKSRSTPISDDVAQHLKNYRLSRRLLCCDEGHFFLWSRGVSVNLRAAEYALQTTRNVLLPKGQLSWARRPPRLYDFRHTFACRTIERWLAEGKDADTLLPILSTYLGHTKVSDTYWYLTGTPEMLDIAASKRSTGIEVTDYDC